MGYVGARCGVVGVRLSIRPDLELNRKDAEDRRDRLLESFRTRAAVDRDGYPAAVGRGKLNGDKCGLVRGINPVGWTADVAHVPSRETRSRRSSLGAKLRGF